MSTAVKLGSVWVWECPGLPIPNVVPHWDPQMALIGCRLVIAADTERQRISEARMAPVRAGGRLVFTDADLDGKLYTLGAGLAVWLNTWRLNRTTWESEMVARYITQLSALLVQATGI